MNVLISQREPSNKAPYVELGSKYGASCVFRPFFLIEPLSAKDLRAQKIDPSQYSAVVFSSRHAIDAYFALCAEFKYKVPDTMKYFCTTELVAMYLQKHIVYRKRKIFFGDGTPESVVSLVGTKHKGEKFLITTTEGSKAEAVSSLFEAAGLDYTVGALIRPVAQNLKDLDLDSFDVAVLYNPNDVKALYENFPGFEQGRLKFVTYGKGIVSAMESAGLNVSVQGPGPEIPSAVSALELCLKSL